ncbi:uncharacterized protein LOC119653367 [Hermetia illucens]|nr:uncharacterized protein LOC119653367 [Hermetia illucens]
MDLQEVITELSRTEEIRTVLYFLNDAEEETDQIILKDLNPLIGTIPKLILKDASQGMTIKDDFNEDTLSLVFASNWTNGTIMETVKGTLKGSVMSKVIFNFCIEDVSEEILEEMFTWLWYHRMFKSLVIWNNHTFTFNPYPDISIAEVTSARSLSSVFSKKVVNFERSSIKVILNLGAASFIKYVDRKGNLQYGGPFLKTILTFIEKRNGTFSEYNRKFSDITELRTALARREVDIMSVMVMGYGTNDELTYPVLFDSSCIMFPYQKEVPRAYYLMLPFQKSSWILVVSGILVLFIFVIVSESLNGRKFSSLFQETLFLVLRMVIQQIDFKDGPLAGRLLIHILGVVHFMLLSSLYQSGLSSFYTKSVAGTQIDTAEDLFRTQYRILIKPQTLYFLRLQSGFGHNVLERFLPTIDPLSGNLNKVNMKFGYFIGTEYLAIFNEIERQYSKRYFHNSKMCLFQTPICIMIQKDYPFKEEFNEVILRLTASGFIDKWQKGVFYENKEAGYINMTLTTESLLRPLVFDELYAIWIIYTIGVFVSITVLAAEILWKLIRTSSCLNLNQF